MSRSNTSFQSLFLLCAAVILSCHVIAQKKTSLSSRGTLKISFINTVKGIPLILNDSTYTNPFKEFYTVGKFRYYVSNVHANTKGSVQKEKNSYHLIDEADPESFSFSFPLKAGNYTSFDFLLGVDSLRNCSGAQAGPLDPMKDMFWTWNSGYVMLKLEGNSPASAQINNRIEYHIGGYAGSNNVIKKIILSSPFEVDVRKTTELIIEADINKLWQGPNDITIARSPVCSTPGPLAKKIAVNYSKMFSIKKINALKN